VLGGSGDHQLEEDGTFELLDGLHDRPALRARDPPGCSDAARRKHIDLERYLADAAFPDRAGRLLIHTASRGIDTGGNPGNCTTSL
jgi:hypothetical protein